MKRIVSLVMLSALCACDGGNGDSPPEATVDGSAETMQDGPVQDGPLSDAIRGGDEYTDTGPLRVVLAWGQRPRDLDAHLTGPVPGVQSYFHVYSGDRDTELVRLAADVTTGSGPEVINIERVHRSSYRYSVFNFSGDADRSLTASGARVEVFAGDTSLAMFSVPPGEGNLWTVFDIDDGQIIPVNRLSRIQNLLDYFPPSGRELAFVVTRAGMSSANALLAR